MSKKNAKKTTALENANREIAHLRSALERTQRTLQSSYSEARSAIDTHVWAIEQARHAATREQTRANEAEQAIDLFTFAEYDRDAADVLLRFIAPKFVKMALRELKAHVLMVPESELRKPPKELFEAWAKKFVREHPELARREPKKTKRSTAKKRAA